MNNYNVRCKLGDGGQGSVHLVEEKVSKKLCVVKKVECSDENEASKAFNEAAALKNLNHPYICGYKEFFVVWEPKEAAIYVCIVMDYYKLGDLDQTLKSKHARGEQLEEEVLMKWVGQMVEALMYVHGMKLIHRDLKPSNIFLKDDMSIAIGDFGVATVMMGTLRDVTRTTVGSINWMAPEVLLDAKPHYDERSDVWSLGCIVLAMAMCGIKSSKQLGTLMFELKTNLEVLEDVLSKIRDRYGCDLCQFIRMALRRGYEQRPYVQQLVELPYVQRCLLLTGSTLYKPPAVDEGGDQDQPVPTEGGVASVITYMSMHSRKEKCQVSALRQILNSDDLKNINNTGKKQLIIAMSSFPASADVQKLSCQVLAKLLASVEVPDGDVLFTAACVKPICLAMRSHADSRDLFAAACTILMVLSSDETAAEVIGRVGGIQDILAAMRSFSDDLDIISDCCTAIWSLSVIDSNLKIMTKENCVHDVYKAISTHSQSKDLADAACSALWSLSLEDRNVSTMVELCIVDLLLQIVERHIQDPGVVKTVCSTLSSVVEVNEIAAFHLLQTEAGLEGIPILIKVLGLYLENDELVEAVCSLLCSLASYEQACEELISLKLQDKLTNLADKLASAETSTDDADTVTATSAIARVLKVLTKPKKKASRVPISSSPRSSVAVSMTPRPSLAEGTPRPSLAEGTPRPSNAGRFSIAAAGETPRPSMAEGSQRPSNAERLSLVEVSIAESSKASPRPSQAEGESP